MARKKKRRARLMVPVDIEITNMEDLPRLVMNLRECVSEMWSTDGWAFKIRPDRLSLFEIGEALGKKGDLT